MCVFLGEGFRTAATGAAHLLRPLGWGVVAGTSNYAKVLTVTRLIALASFLALAGLIYLRYTQVIADVGSFTAAQRIGDATQQVVEAARDVALASRGFAITGRDDFLARHQAAKDRLQAQVERLKAALPEDPQERVGGDALLGHVSRLTDVTDQVIAARQQGGAEAADKAMLAADEPGTVNAVRDSADRLLALTRQHIRNERGVSATSRLLTGYLMFGTFLLAVAMLAYAGWQVHKELGRRGQAEGKLLLANANVEHEVQLRTEELVRAHDARDDLLRREQVARADAEMANRTKDEFLAAVSHELRTPLNAIVGWTHILKFDTGENRTRAVEAIERNALVQARLIDDLLDLSRLTRGRFGLTLSTIDLGTAVQSALVTIGPTASAKGVTIVVRADDGVAVRGDDARLQQVAWNLLSNAVKYTPAGGQVTVDVSRLGPRARLRVTDTGEGIDPEFLPHVFEPFSQGDGRGRRPGLGLGLSIVRQIVELHGGSILAASEGPHRGSSFTVVLPLSEPAVPAAPALATLARQLNIRVLVVEDDEDSAVTLSALLAHHGCEVRIAHSVAEAEAEFRLAKPDLLLCDIGLPDGDGLSLLRRLRVSSEVFVPAIALSALARDEDRSRAAEAGFAAYLTKPYDPDQLFDAIFRVTAAKTG